MISNKINLKAIAFVCVLALLISAVPVVYADDVVTPTLTVGSTTAYPGQTAYVYINVQNAQSLGVLEFYLTYDADVLTYSANTVYTSSGNDRMEMITVKEENSGYLKVTAMDSAGATASNMSLVRIAFQVSEAAEVGRVCPLQLSVGTVMNSSWQSISMSKSDGSITIKEASAPKASFNLSADSSVAAGNDISITLSSYSLGGMTAGIFNFEYNNDYFEFKSLTPAFGLSDSEDLWNVSFTNEGLVAGSWVGSAAPPTGDLMTLTLTAKENVSGSQTITCTPLQLYNSSEEAIQASAVSKTVTIIEKVSEGDLPDFWLEGETELACNETLILTAKVEGHSALAAADFDVYYDPAVLEFVSVEKDGSVSGDMAENQQTATVLVNHNEQQGCIRISMILSGGLSLDTILAQIQWKAKTNEHGTTEITTAVSDAVDSEFNAVELELKNSEITVVGHYEVIDEAVAPTCTETGLTEGKHCSVCNEVLVKQEVVDALGHKYESVVTAPTCTEKGYTTYTCSVCGDSYEADEVAALGHTEVIDKAVAPTCTETGLTQGKHCSVCGEVLLAQEVVPERHSMEIMEAKSPTCTEEGLTEGYYCRNCTDVYVAQEKIPALGHTKVVDAAVDATCTETGLTEGSHCSVCEKVFTAQEKIPALGHTEGEVVVENEVASDCENAGSYDNVVYCTVCGDELSRETVTVSAHGHTEVIDEAVAATCTETGLTEGKHCSVCSEVLVAQTVVAALGHSYGYEPIDAAQHKKTCSACGESCLEDHNWENNACKACGINDVVVYVDGSTALISTACLKAGDLLIVASYDGNAMESVAVYTWQNSLSMNIDLPDANDVRLFFLTDEGVPVRNRLDLK